MINSIDRLFDLYYQQQDFVCLSVPVSQLGGSFLVCFAMLNNRPLSRGKGGDMNPHHKGKQKCREADHIISDPSPIKGVPMMLLCPRMMNPLSVVMLAQSDGISSRTSRRRRVLLQILATTIAVRVGL